MNINNIKYVVVGAGFFGSVIAERIAADKKERVAVIESRNHFGGNCYSEIDEKTGIEIHKYGSHIFHTSSKKVWDYLNNFCSFNHYRHKVLTQYKGRVYQMPINLATINAFYGVNLAPFQIKDFLNDEIRRENISNPENLEEKAISLIGRPLYEAFIKGYTIKQWGTDPRELSSSIITRLPVRCSFKNEYFDDPWQGIPVEGYSSIFENLLDHENIEVHLNTNFFSVRHMIPRDCIIIYSGPIDRYFDYKYGKLGWRTLTFEKEVHGVDDYQGTSVLNFAERSIPYTRVHEFKHFHEERNYDKDQTVIFREYSKQSVSDNDPYYPINTREDREIFRLYEAESRKSSNVIFGGRLGSYKYLDMDKAVESALNTYEDKIKFR